MSKFDLDDLRAIMRESAGVDEDIDLNGDIADIEFTELGYDSLAVLELASQVQRKYSVPIPDDAVHEMLTPRAAVDYINKQFSIAGV
ncbi:MAG TPA: acyl carrier protein [Actinokineospora sp.]|nr:acyl carrier protein [Actinokineospora sp.]